MSLRSALLFCLAFIFMPLSASAHSPRFVDVGQHDTVTIENPEVSQAFYGELKNFPHLFQIKSDTQFDLNLEILAPDIKSAKNNISGIIIRVPDHPGVEEVARIPASNGTWDSEYEYFGGDAYRNGPKFKKTLPRGTYQIEVSTPDNLGKYVLVVGTKEEFSVWDYFGTVRDIAKIKIFFGKPIIFVLQSPFVYIPTIIFSVLGFFIYQRYKKPVVT